MNDCYGLAEGGALTTGKTVSIWIALHERRLFNGEMIKGKAIVQITMDYGFSAVLAYYDLCFLSLTDSFITYGKRVFLQCRKLHRLDCCFHQNFPVR